MNSQVLIPSNDPAFPQTFLEGYRAVGLEPVLGEANLRYGTVHANIVHLLWPEEFCGWKCPDLKHIEELGGILSRRREKSAIIQSVNNLYPHGGHGDSRWHELYSTFYRSADIIHHFSNASKSALIEEYPEFVNSKHVVTPGIDYSHVAKMRKMQDSAVRREIGIDADKVVFLVLGAIRFRSELMLLFDAWRRIRRRDAQLVFAGRLSFREDVGRIQDKLLKAWARLELRRMGAIVIDRFIGEEDLPALFDASDAVIVLRNGSLSSGIPCLGMCLGRYVIAPKTGAIEEYLGSVNPGLYKPGNGLELALAIQRAFEFDRDSIGAENFERSTRWNWEIGARTLLRELRGHRSVLQQHSAVTDLERREWD